MLFTNLNNKLLSYAMVLVGLITLCSFEGSAAATSAQNNSAFVRQRPAMGADETGLSNPAGLAFSSRAKAFHVMKRRKQGKPPSAKADIIKLRRFSDRIDSARIAAAIKNPINMAFDNKAERLLIFQSARNKLIEVLEGPDGHLDPTTLIRHDARHFGLQNPQGMTVDPASGHLFILDNAALRIVRIEPEPDGSFDRAVISYVDLQSTGLVDVRGLAFDPATENLHVLNPAEQKLYELTQTGKTVTTRDLSEFELGDPQGMVFAPSGDQTDDPLQMSLYLTDSGLVARSGQGASLPENGSAAAMPSIGPDDVNAAAQAPGEIVELSFIEPPAAAASTFQSSLIQTINAWQWSPPSPDSAGIVYLPASDRLLVCDSEVNEMPIFTGDNLFEATLTGNLMNTLTTVSFSDEPTGVTLNPSNGHLFYSDDTGTRSIYEMNPGPDGQYDTSDDIITSFKTGDFGSSDPEGVAFASGLGALFITDGVNEEVYQVTPGVNGIFDGVPPAGDDHMTSFDTTSLGTLDPEGIAFNSNNGNLYLVGKPADTLFEVTIDGALVQTIDISAANARKPAGLAYAPSSLNPNVMNIYIAARGVDNDSNPDENDGKVYEMTLPASTNHPPVASDDSDSTTVDTPVTIDVAANDTDPNGNLDPTSANSICAYGSTGCDGALNGSLTDNGDGTISYTPDAGFTGFDNFVYEICDTEPLCDTATADITVTLSNDPPVAVDDNANTSEDMPVTIDVAANDSDPDDNLDPTSANSSCTNGSTGCDGALNGSLTDNGDGTITYSPDPGFNGADSFVYEICDTFGACNTAGASITIDPVADPPVAVDDSANTSEDTPVTIDVAANDSDPDGNLDPASVNTTCATCADAADGTLLNHGDGTISYSPDPGFTGSDNFVYEICDTEPLCDTAMATITVNPAGSMIIEVRVSASTDDAEEKPTGGMRLTSSDLEFVYDKGDQTVGMRFNGVEVPQGATITSAYIQFQVDEVNTVDTNLSIQGQASDAPVTFTASTGNVSNRPRTVAAVSWAPEPWTTKGEAGPGQQTPDISAIIQEIVNRPGWTSGNSLVIIITGTGERTAESFDGTPSAAPLLHVGFSSGGQSNNPPVANDDSASTTVDTPVTIDVAANDTDPNGNLDPASANTTCGTCSDPANGSLLNHGDGSFSYTPDAGFTGSDNFVYEICDTEPLCDTATADITVTLSNDPPVAVDDNANTSEDMPVTIDVAANDSDPDGNLDPASANTTCGTCADPANGILLNHGDGTFSYSPDPDFNGADSFVYEICDTFGACDTAGASITIDPVADAPVAADDSANTLEDTLVTIDVAANDTDSDGNLDPTSANTSCGTCSVPVNGNLDNNNDGSFSYTPVPGFTGSDNFVYEICDTEPLCDTAMATITVNPAAPMTIEVRVAASTDDAEEKQSGGMRLTSSDLEFVYDKGDQTVGMRFNGVEVPQGATITSAYIQFQVDEVNTVDTNLSIQGQASDAPVTFTASTGNVSNRPRTVAAVSWAPEPWTTKGEAGPGQQTPDISAIIQEIVNRPGWTSGNSLVIIITGTGERTAESFDGTPSAAPLLHVGFSSGN